MRKYQQRKIFELLQTIKEAQSVGLYAEAQEGALAVGGFIESIVGNGTNTVALLEQHCELLFKASNKEVHGKVLLEHLIKIEKTVRNELIPSKIEIAFLSYNASMSDCILSIYRAARSDPRCDAYFIPIPFYERNNDGSLGAFHYEGAECYESDVECVAWQKYDFEARHPDVIFTFAAYDSYNYVTSIRPNLYCKHLREMTDLLVYTPYFVAIEEVQSYFCTTAGCIFAHKVVLQSEKIRNRYISVFKDEYGNKFGEPQEKFVALGSAKYDAVIRMKRDDYNLPDEWRQMISNKKVVLLNTSISMFLQNDEQYLKKLKFVLSIFQKRKDIALWWRPHPLGEATYKSMRLGLLNEYKEIVDYYKQGGWGIYDETTNLHRAIAWGDAYYGDWSSVISLYQATGKPIMIGNIDQQQIELKLELVPLYVDTNSALLLANHVNALFKMSTDTWKAELIGSFPNEVIYDFKSEMPLYRDAAINKGIIYFSPFLAKEIATYSIADKSFGKIHYKKLNNGCVNEGDFCGVASYGDFVYFTPYQYPAIMRLNTLTGEIDYFSDWVEPLNKLKNDRLNRFFLHPIVVGNSIWLAAIGANAIVEFNLETNCSKVYEIGEKTYRYKSICFDGESFWLSTKGNNKTPFIKCKLNNERFEICSEIYLNTEEKISFSTIVYCRGFIWILPLSSKHAYKIDVVTEIASLAEEYDFSFEVTESGKKKYLRTLMFDDCIFAYNELTETFIKYNSATNERIEERIHFSAETVIQMKQLVEGAFIQDTEKMKSERDCYYYENGVVQLNDFLDFVVNDADTKQMQDRRREILQENNTNADGTAGQAIYDFVKKTILG